MAVLSINNLAGISSVGSRNKSVQWRKGASGTGWELMTRDQTKLGMLAAVMVWGSKR